MQDFIAPSLVGGLAVFAGLILLWSAIGFATLRQRVRHAAFAGAVSALATLLISGAVSGAL